MPTVLLIGEDASFLEPVRRLPGATAFETTTAAGGADALRRLRRTAFDAVITSPRTPIAEDLALLEEIRAVRPGVRYVILAPRATTEDIFAVLRAQAFACFTEPINWIELAGLLDAAFRDEGWRDSIEVRSASANWVSLRVTSRLLTAERVTQFMRELAADQRDDDRENLVFAFREMLLNAMEHGTGFDPDQVIDIAAVRTDRAIVYYFRDPGPGFEKRRVPHATASRRPADIEKAAVVREARGLRPGGFGMLIVRQLVDEVIYNEAGNEVLLIKHTQ
jgi:anti-sigma regulatory factor (Ser/Thr protein kinase)/ActR/RegA family two-component response regulator